MRVFFRPAKQAVQPHDCVVGNRVLQARRFLVDIAKRFGLPDGSAPTASLVINLIGFVLFVVANIFGFDTAGIDKILAGVASGLTALLGLLGQLMVSRGVHAGLRGGGSPRYTVGRPQSDSAAPSSMIWY